MRNVPLHESHLLEAVRRKILSSDQMEQVLALARARPAGGAIADVRWATVVQGLLASAAVGGSALGILVDTTDHGANLGTVAYSVVGLLAMLGASIALRRYAWGRVPAAILLAGVAVWSYGVAVGVVGMLLPFGQHAVNPYDTGFYDPRVAALRAFRGDVAMAVGSLVAAATAYALWRLRRCAPALGVAAAAVMLAGERAFEMAMRDQGGYSDGTTAALVVLGLGAAIFTAASLRDRAPKGAVDGVFWVHPVAMFPMGIAAILRIDRHGEELLLWFPLALALGAIAYAQGRKLPLLFSAMAVLVFPAFAVADAHAPPAAVVMVLVACGAVIGLGAQWVRARDLERPATDADPASIWS